MADPREDFPTPDEHELVANLALADHCEALAQNNDERYKEHLIDVTGKTGIAGSLGVQTRTVLGFEAERMRECDERGSFGDVLASEYEISSTHERYELSGFDLPHAIRAEVIKRKLCEPNDIFHPGSVFMLGYYLGFDVTSEGECDHQINVYVGNGQRVAYLKQKVVLRAIAAVLHDERHMNREFANNSRHDDGLEDMFTTNDFGELEELLVGLESRERGSKASRSFFNDVATLVERLKKSPHNLAFEVLESLFVTKPAE